MSDKSYLSVYAKSFNWAGFKKKKFDHFENDFNQKNSMILLSKICGILLMSSRYL